jgi:hypothetical protein
VVDGGTIASVKSMPVFSWWKRDASNTSKSSLNRRKSCLHSNGRS